MKLTPQIKAAVNTLRPLTRAERRVAIALDSSVNAIIIGMIGTDCPVRIRPMMKKTTAGGGRPNGSNPEMVKEILRDIGYDIFKDPGYEGMGPAPELISRKKHSRE